MQKWPKTTQWGPIAKLLFAHLCIYILTTYYINIRPKMAI